MSRILFRMLIGCIAGLIAWAIIEPSNPGTTTGNANWGQFEQHMVASLGFFTGLAIGAYNAFVMGGRLRMILACTLGPLLGVIGAFMGYGIGTRLQVIVFHESMEQMMATGQIVPLYLSRIIALTPIGTVLGAAIGAASLDWRRVMHGAIGGTIGGCIGGMLFDPIAIIVGGAVLAAKGQNAGEIGLASRVVYFVVMSGAIALFIGIVEQVAKHASLFLAVGRNEGREFPLFAQRNLIGRNELAQVPIFNDPAIAPAHAYVERQGPVYFLIDAGSGAPTFLNGQQISSAPLDHGAQIQIGNTMLQFRLKALAKSVPVGRPYAMTPLGQMPMPTATQSQMSPGSLYNAPGPTQSQHVPINQPTTVIAPQPTAPTLAIVDGAMAGQRFPIGNALEIGREASGIALRHDSAASRRHASVSNAPSGLMIQDLGSTNGTYVNGQRVTTATIRLGDVVKIGSTTFRVE